MKDCVGSQSSVPPVTNNLPQPQNYSPATTAATAAPAASFPPLILLHNFETLAGVQD
jgi:hypothetical protein